MNLKILSGVNGAKQAKGIVIIIDVFRASSTILACLSQGAKQIIPIETVKEARELKSKHPSWILVGERNGEKLPGFDYGNSPATMMKLDLQNQIVILTTSSGTKGIHQAKNAKECIIGSFGNVSVISTYIKENNPRDVSIIPMGLNANMPAIEDDCCAQYIYNEILKISFDKKSLLNPIMGSDGIKRLHRLNQSQDVSYCLTLDSFPLIPKYQINKQNIIKKENLV